MLYKLLVSKNQKGSIRYPMTLYKRNCTGDNFPKNIQFFSRQAISQDSSKPLAVKGLYFLRMWNDNCFCWTAQGKLSQCNRKNFATVLKAVVKCHKGLKGTKVFACLEEILKYLKISMEEPVLDSSYCKVAAWISLYKKAKLKVTRSSLSNKRRLHRDPYTYNFL